MFAPAYKIYINNKYFDSMYTVDYYNDKKVFFQTGARLFFVLYQIISCRKFEVEIEGTGNNNGKTVINDELKFSEWVKINYPMYINYLENYN